MFDTIIHKTETRAAPAYPQTVHEHRAPTDESIKLYAEMMAKARAEVVSTVVNDFQPNVLNHVKLSTRWDMLNDKVHAIVAFKLNGVEHTINVSEDKRDMRNEMARAIVQALIAAVGEQLWRELPGGRGVLR